MFFQDTMIAQNEALLQQCFRLSIYDGVTICRPSLLHQPSRTTFLSLLFIQIQLVRIQGCLTFYIMSVIYHAIIVISLKSSKYKPQKSKCTNLNPELISVFIQIQTINQVYNKVKIILSIFLIDSTTTQAKNRYSILDWWLFICLL